MEPNTIFPRTSAPARTRPLAFFPDTFLLFGAAALVAATAAAAQRLPDRPVRAEEGRAGAEAPAAPAELRAPRNVLVHAASLGRMIYDAPGDGSLWASGARYKASFDASGATYYPAFGKRAPHDVPHALSPDSVTIGGEALAFERSAGASRDGDRVAIDRGSFVEAYDLTPETVEQTFVFSSLPRGGDIVVHIAVASEMDGVQTENGLEFRGELGRVTYGRATAIDARGQRTTAATEIENGAITIRVDGEFLAGAVPPVVIDPLITTVFITGIADDDFQPDVAYDPFNQVWLVTYQKTFSASDMDAYAQVYLDSGALVTTQAIDVTGDSWVSVRCADCAAAHNFLVVAENIHNTTHTIRGRIAIPNGTLLTVGAQITISDNSSGNKTAPSVGGDPFVGFPSNFCVAYVQEISSSDSSISVCTVSSGGVPSAPISLAHIATQTDTAPSVSKSNDTNNWLIAWRRSDGILLGDIWAAHVHFDGALIDGPFGITSGGLANDFAPSASSPLHGTTRSAIAFSRNVAASTNREVMVAALEGTTVLQIADLNGMEPNGNPSQDQLEPAIDSDGRHFLVAYSELQPITGTYVVFGTDLYLSGSQLGVSESHILFHQFGLSEHNSRMSAAHDVNASSHRFFSVYDVVENSTDRDVDGALFDVVEGGATSPFCVGTAATCPCGNGGSATNGCANSVNSNGGGLLVSGTASTLNDSVSLLATDMPPGTTCLFFQGTTHGPTAFGDGLLCVSSPVVRLATKTAGVSGLSLYPNTGDAPISVRGMIPANGGQSAYQVWYRNAAAFCTSSTFNLTSGALIDWAR